MKNGSDAPVLLVMGKEGHFPIYSLKRVKATVLALLMTAV